MSPAKQGGRDLGDEVVLMCYAVGLAQGPRFKELGNGLETYFRAAVGVKVNVDALRSEKAGSEASDSGTEGVARGNYCVVGILGAGLG